MTQFLRRVFPKAAAPPWNDSEPVREELFGVERLEQHAQSLAAAQPVTRSPPRVLPLQERLNTNAAALLAAYRASAAELESGRAVVPAAEWLLDNYHVVEEQIREIRDDLPPGYYRQLPKLAQGPFAGYPRVFGIAWAFVAHTDSFFDPVILRRFISAYQSVQPLTIGELWAVAITLRIVLVENLRRLAGQISAGRAERADADALADRLLAPGGARAALEADIAARSPAPLSDRFAAQLAKRLRDQDPRATPALGWLDERLAAQGVTIDEAVRQTHDRQGMSNVTVRNVITSMRLISDIDWADLFESVSLVDARLRAASAFAAMDFRTRNSYRSAIENLSRGSPLSETEIAERALETARSAAAEAGAGEAERLGDPGFYLVSDGRPVFERRIGFRAPPRTAAIRLLTRPGIIGYAGAILCLAALLVTGALRAVDSGDIGAGRLTLLWLAGFLPAAELAAALVNRAVTSVFGAKTLPGLALAGGVPQAMRTLVVVPVISTGEAGLLEQIETLEVHHLSGADGDISFAVLSDGADADTETVPGEAGMLAAAAAAVDELNRRHGPGPSGQRFFLLHRRRVFNAGENKWMGWERKRGKLHELNRLLRGAADTTFAPVAGRPPSVPAQVRFVITLDADTRLPRGAALQLIGKMAHPLNRPRFSAGEQRVVSGYAILQPRVTPSLPVGREGSLYQRVFSGPGGMDPYAAAVSDVYQDIFGEGSYTGKGIYDVDAFEAALAGRIPDSTMLSHDLFEGVFARAGLASDVEVVEEFPSRYDVAARRQHRWARGDWQLLGWLAGRRGAPSPAPLTGRWKMLDNLRRSLTPPAVLLTLALSWLLPQPAALRATLLILAAGALPAVIPVFFALWPRRSGILLRSHLMMLGDDIRMAALQIFLALAFLPDHAFRMGDAILRTLWRLCVSRRHLLEWTTTAQTAGGPHPGPARFYRLMAGGTALALATALAATLAAPWNGLIILPFAALWAGAPALAYLTSRAPRSMGASGGALSGARDLRLTARRTWRYFEMFVTAADNMLPPDNFQEEPMPVVARRTSPTNMGLYLLSAAVARDFGWAGTNETLDRLEATLAAMESLPRFNGHFFNWYGTRDLKVLEPAYVSSVDSGNLAGHLIALANACEEWMSQGPAPGLRHGIADQAALAREALGARKDLADSGRSELSGLLAQAEAMLARGDASDTLFPALGRVTEALSAAAGGLGAAPPAQGDDLAFWIGALRKSVAEHERDRIELAAAPNIFAARLSALAAAARQMALSMDFRFLLDPDRKLMVIGYSMAENRPDSSCYDLLASEARLASLFAIAKGDFPTRHWFRLGRAATPMAGGSALISWSGSMFEYLMPSLVMRAPAGSLLEQTNRTVVGRQQAYGAMKGVPWGISESAYNARDREFTYQYSNFGVPGLGLKRGLSDNLVIAPYATGLAAMVDPEAARANFARLASMGARGAYGFYEALDFTRARLPENAEVAVVRSYMAHHQGMTIVAIANVLNDGVMRARFHREPMIMACDLLLQERVPRAVAIAHPRAEEVTASAIETGAQPDALRRLTAPVAGPPVTHLLSNGRYAVMLSASGAGYSRWRDIAVTRWREDATRDDWGSFIFLRDAQSGAFWSAGAQPLASPADGNEVIFSDDRAEFISADPTLKTVMDVLVSGEDDGEVRRISLTNSGRRAREIELTSYAEIVLTTPAADSTHPAFAKMFVQTAHLPEFDALTATRRPRSQGEPQVWAAHFAVVEGALSQEPQFETDRAAFLGRGRTIADADALSDGRKLAGGAGTVLDPIFSLRRRVRIGPGKVARIAFWTVVASSQAELLDLVDKHYDRSAYDRVKTLAWTKSQVQLRHLDVEAEEAADFQRLAAPLLYADARFRAPSDSLIRGAGPQSGLWRHSISGDLPIVLLRIDDTDDIEQVRQLLRAHEYWRMKGLGVDLVIINERASSYLQDLQIAIETAVRSSQARPRFGGETGQGTVHTLRADLMSVESRALLLSVARVALSARRGPIAAQLARAPATPAPTPPVPKSGARREAPLLLPTPPDLEFFNGLGGFDRNGTEYVTVLNAGGVTPAPWINVIANPAFGFQVAAEGGGYTWAENSRDNQLTQWSNDPVSDASGEAIYIRDEISRELWSPTAQPIRGKGTYIARHGFGHSRFEHHANGIAQDLLQYVPLADPVKISRLTLRNLTARTRRLSVTVYAEWVLGTSRSGSAPFISTQIDTETGAILARNPWNIGFSGRVAFSDLGGRQTAWTGDRGEFLGQGGAMAAPAALLGSAPLSGAAGAGRDPCAALQCTVELAAGEMTEIVWFLGECVSAEASRALIQHYRKTSLDAVLGQVKDHWQSMLGAVQVKTPDRAMDIMLNGWLLYQTLACRIWARSAFYQASGAYGFRDQLQDGMALSFAWPEETRRHILRANGRQFAEGDVQHWWLPQSGTGVRTRISDDRVWLAFATATYVRSSADTGILDELVPFIEGPALRAGEHDSLFQPMTAGDSATVFEHCARGLDQCIALTGGLGLPLIGTGDWNDGMSRVGQGGKGESVWLGWLLARTIELFAPLAKGRDDKRARRWRAHGGALKKALEAQAWDGGWYRRATFDDGEWLGSKDSEECRIDSIAQSWAILSGAADPARAAAAMAALDTHLIRRDDALALLFTPPFDKTQHDPGYIKGYPPGLRENGGQYSHAAMWAILAFAKMGAGDKAADIFALLNPINHARTPEGAAVYKVEPYVVAADVYSVAPHAGRGGWTWYTGAAGWMYRAGVEGILGLRREGRTLVIDPRLPPAWPGFEATVRIGASEYAVRVETAPHSERKDWRVSLDGAPAAATEMPVRVPLDSAVHTLLITG